MISGEIQISVLMIMGPKPAQGYMRAEAEAESEAEVLRRSQNSIGPP